MAVNSIEAEIEDRIQIGISKGIAAWIDDFNDVEAKRILTEMSHTIQRIRRNLITLERHPTEYRKLQDIEDRIDYVVRHFV